MSERIVFADERAEYLRSQDGLVVLETFDFGDAGNAYAVEVDGDEDEVLSFLEEDDRITGVEPNVEAEVAMAPLGGTTATAQGKDPVTIEEGEQFHRFAKTGINPMGHTVFVMDTGIDESHPVFAKSEVEHVDMTGEGEDDQFGHGTACASIIERLAPGVDFISVKILGKEGRGDLRSILRGYDWLLRNTDRFTCGNMSFGTRQRVKPLDKIHNKLVSKGVPVAVAAGNSGQKAGSPARAELAFSVGACNIEGELADFSAYGPDTPDTTALGVDVRMAQAEGTKMGRPVEGKWIAADGTSFAAPFQCAGLLGFASRHGHLSMEETVRAYERNARDISGTSKDGAGILNQNATVFDTRLPEPPQPPMETASATVIGSGDHDVAWIEADWFRDSWFKNYEATLLKDGPGSKVIRFQR